MHASWLSKLQCHLLHPERRVAAAATAQAASRILPAIVSTARSCGRPTAPETPVRAGGRMAVPPGEPTPAPPPRVLARMAHLLDVEAAREPRIGARTRERDPL